MTDVPLRPRQIWIVGAMMVVVMVTDDSDGETGDGTQTGDGSAQQVSDPTASGGVVGA